MDFLDGLKGQNGGKASLVTRTQYLNLLKSVFKFAVEQGRVPKQYNPVANLKPAKKRKDAEPEILTVDEVRSIFSFVKNNPKYHSFIPVLAVGFFCGARVEERAKLTYGDIFVGGRNEIFVSAAVAKNGIARFISNAVLPALPECSRAAKMFRASLFDFRKKRPTSCSRWGIFLTLEGGDQNRHPRSFSEP